MEGSLTASGEVTDLVVGARVDIDDSVALIVAERPDIDGELIRTTFEGVADLDPDDEGRCQSLSVGFVAEAR